MSFPEDEPKKRRKQGVSILVKKKTHTKDDVYSNLKYSASFKGNGAKEEYMWRQRINELLDNKYVTIVVSLMTLVALFGDDTRLAFLGKSADIYVDCLLLTCFIAFLAELVLQCFAKTGYNLSFFFWLDLVALLSLVPDIYFLIELFTGDSAGLSVTGDATQVARAGRASRAGTRAGRLIKLVRLIRLVRVVKLYKQTKQAFDIREKKKQAEEKRAAAVAAQTLETENEDRERRVRKKQKSNLSEMKLSFFDQKTGPATVKNKIKRM